MKSCQEGRGRVVCNLKCQGVIHGLLVCLCDCEATSVTMSVCETSQLINT